MEPGSVVRAVFEFLPSVSEELPLFPGDVIEVLSVLDEFWLLGNKDGVTGKVVEIFIANHKEIRTSYLTVEDTGFGQSVSSLCLKCQLKRSGSTF